MAAYLEQNIEVVKNYIYRQIGEVFQQNFPMLDEVCSRHGIRKLDNFEVDNIIQHQQAAKVLLTT